ncbi:hypothetical protein HK096_008856 [Nowakowskiella sp. JEL0078]|nr:hypothetical protein HK096_008856 [Nowakowskiella sp. JEL0078]
MSVEWKVELTAKDIVDETSMLTGDCDKTVFAISSSKPNKNTSDTSGTSSFISDTSKESTDHKTKGDKTGTDREYDPIQLIFEYTREISEPDFTTNIKKSTKISDAAGINSNENECRLEKKFSIDTKAVDDNFIMSSLENGSQVNKQKRSSIESEIQFPQLSENPDLDDPIAALLDSISKGYDEFKAKKHNYEYLVIYVHMIVRVVNRLKSKGFSIQMIPVPDVPEMKMAVSKDPNGVEIRFIEMSDVLLGESNLNAKKPWFSRPAYYTIPTNFAQDTVRRYERMFGTQTSVVHLRNRKQNIAMNKQLTNSNASLNMSSSTQVTTIDQMMAINSSISVATGFKLPQLATLVNSLIGTSDGDKKELALSVNKVSGVLKGFRLVDTEDIINGNYYDFLKKKYSSNLTDFITFNCVTSTKWARPMTSTPDT